jgi:cytoskeletal protein CcmA (bactofilin family)
VYAVLGLLALFTILRAYGEDRQQGARYILHPGVLEFETAEGSGQLAFGLLDLAGTDGQGRSWNLLPLRVSLSSGKQSFTLALNGLSLLAPGGMRIGRPVRITGQKTGDVISIGGEVTVAGTVDGDVWTLGARVRLLPQSVVTGSVVALGGTIEADRRALIRGNKYSLPNLKIPLLDLLSSGQSAATFRFLIELMGVLLYLLVLFLVVHFARERFTGLTGALGSYWKGSILYLVLSAFVLPLVLALLVATILGILLVPFLVLAVLVLGYLGYLGATVRLGLWIRRQKTEVAAVEAYTSGLLGLLIVKGPAVLGILFGLLASEALQAVGRFLFALGTVEMIAAALYGFGGVLRFLRAQASSG